MTNFRYTSFIAFLFLAVGFFTPTVVEAFFFDTEESYENTFSAGKLEINLDIEEESGAERSVTISPASGSAGFDYAVNAELGAENLCSALQVEAGGFSGALSNLSLDGQLDPDGQDTINFKFSLSNSGGFSATDSCSVDVIYKAHQADYSYGQAFYDIKTDSFTLTGEDLGIAPTSSTTSDVVISEIAWMGREGRASDEWMELHNRGSQEVDLANWKLVANDGTPNITIPSNGNYVIPAGGYFLLERTDDDSVPDITADLIYTGDLGNDGEFLRLLDASGKEIDSVSGGNSWEVGGDNGTKETAQRRNDNTWCTAVPTPREENDCGNNLVSTTPSLYVAPLLIENTKDKTIPETRIASSGSEKKEEEIPKPAPAIVSNEERMDTEKKSEEVVVENAPPTSGTNIKNKEVGEESTNK